MIVARRAVGLLFLAGVPLWLGAAGQFAPMTTGPEAVLPSQHSAPTPEYLAMVESWEQALLPDLRLVPPYGFYLVDQTPASDKRLKFTTTVWNAGPGPLEVRGHEDPVSGGLAVQQILHTAGGATLPGGLVGEFQFEHRHGHLHLAGFASYELWSVGPDDEPLELVAQNEKVGFCLMDNLVVDEEIAEAQGEPVYPIDCEAEVQGISPGYGDVYVAQLYEQDLVITGLPDGRYALVNVANPDGAILEATHSNNRETVFITLDGRRVIPD